MSALRVVIAVCAVDEERRRRLLELVRGSAAAEDVVTLPSPAACAELAAAVFVIDGEEPGRPFLAALRGRAPDSALVQIGGAPSSDPVPTCWFAEAPHVEVLAALWRERARPAPPGATGPLQWRRKSDMIVGRSESVMQLWQALDRLAPSSASVLITGASGTGKELVARALHYCGPRARAPFLAINCAAIPEPLFEAELFGYERGAFTGAQTARIGAFETAHRGTLFLDEIGELPLGLQPKLLRVLESGEVPRLGGSEARTVEVRVVTATNRDLEREVAEGRFRQDLYYRLSVCPLHLPPLRERPEDIPPLVHHHLALLCERQRRAPPTLTSAALERLLAHAWPGNVRELINALERALLVAGRTIDATHFELKTRGDDPGLVSYRQAKTSFERSYYSQLMRVTGGNISLAAKLAQKTRKEIYDALRRLGEDVVSFRADDPS